MAKLDQQYPEPEGDNWIDKYRNAKALEKVSEELINFFTNLDSHYTLLLEKEKEDDKSIEEA